MNEEELPEGWATAPLTAFLEPGGIFDGPFGSSLKTSDYTSTGVRVIRLENLANLQFVAEKRTFISATKHDELKKHTVREGDLLVGSFVDGAVRVCILPRLDTPAIAKADCFCVRPKRETIDPRYLAFQLGSMRTRDSLIEEIHGATRPRITTKQLRSFELLIPPLAEQRRIVAAVERALAKVNAVRDRLARVPATLKRFRQAVLAAACSGRLTADWQEENPKIVASRDAIDVSDLPKDDEWPDELPGTWRMASVANLCAAIVDCPHSTPKWTSQGEICLRTTNFLPGCLDLSVVRYVSAATFQERSRRLQPAPGDIVYSREGGILGIACIIPEGLRTCLGQRMMLLRVHGWMTAEFVMHILNCPATLHVVEELTGGTASPHLNVGDVKAFRVPLPPLLEQHEIVRRVSALFALADRIEAKVAAATKKADGLTQAVLAKAFRGELVPTEAELARREGRDYEPADKLLERIKAERSTPPPAPSPKREGGE